MAVEIKELIIRAVMNEAKTNTPPAGIMNAVNSQLLKTIKELSKKNKKNER